MEGWLKKLPVYITVSEIRKRQIPQNITYVHKLNYDTNELIYRHREQICGCQKESGVEEGWTSRLMLAEMQNIIYRIDNKVLLYSTGNYIQYTVKNQNGKEYEKCIIWITKSLCYTAKINTAL